MRLIKRKPIFCLPAIADRYQKFGCDFYIANYDHFAYLVGRDYESAVEILTQKLDRVG